MKPEEHPAQFWSKHLDRRQLLKTLGWIGLIGSGAALSGARGLAQAMAPHPSGAAVEPAERTVGTGTAAGDIPRRKLGKTGVEVSALCFGGAHWGGMRSDEDAIRVLNEAIEAGVTFLDNAWEYNGGRSEELMGKALQGRRQQVFLMTKVCSHGRDKKVALRQLDESLRRLKTDYLDLWQIHEVVYDDDPDRHFAPNGATDALLEARKQGKVRFLGFTGHKHPRMHLKMLQHDFPFDICQLPLNVFDGTYRSFEQEVLPVLQQRGIAPLAMKTLSGNAEPIKQGIVTVEEALRYVLSLPVASVVSGIDSREVLQQNLAVVRRFTPMTAVEMQTLRTRVARYAMDGRFELFKSSNRYDGRIGREQHGLS